MPVASPDTSLSLLDRLRDPGDADAWGRLVAVYTGLLRAWFGAAGLQPADRDDLTQRVFEVLLRRLPDFRHTGRAGAFRAFLRGVAANFLREFWRGRAPADAAGLDRLIDPRSDLGRLWDEEHDRHVLHGLMDLVRPEFTGPTWQAFVRVALDGAPARQAAAELGLTVNAVLIAKSRVLARLRREARGLLD